MKICSKCKVNKPLSDFNNMKTSKDGLRYECKECAKNRSKTYKIKNPDYNKQYYINNKEHIIKNVNKRRLDNPDYDRQYSKQYRLNNPKKIATYKRMERARRAGWKSPEPINDYFENSELHHLHILNKETGEVDRRVSIFIPIQLHKEIWHSHKIQSTMDEINEIVMEWYYEH